MWSDEDVSDAMNRTKGLPVRLCGETVRAIMTRAVELAAARGGTMTAEELDIASAYIPGLNSSLREMTSRMIDHIATQGARVAVLEAEVQRLSGLAAVTECIAARRERNAALADAEAFRAQTEKARQSEAVWRKRLESVDEELGDIGTDKLGRLDVVTRVRILKARLPPTMSVAGQASRAHVGQTTGGATVCGVDCHLSDDRPYPERHPHAYTNSRGQNDDCEWHHADGRCGWQEDVHIHPCSPTCTHDDAATPGHAERVKARSELIKVSNDSHAAGAEAMRAACLLEVQTWAQGRGLTREETQSLKAAIEGAAP